MKTKTSQPSARELDVHSSDVRTLLQVLATGSVSAAARERKMTSSAVSKSVRRLEQELGLQLLVRQGRGIALTEQGRLMVPRLQDLLERIAALGQSHRAGAWLTFAAPSSLFPNLMLALAGTLDASVRGLELPPRVIQEFAFAGWLDLAICEQFAPVPSSWDATKIGEFRSALLASPRLRAALGPGPVAPRELLKKPFVAGTRFVRGQFVPNSDDCPLPEEEREVVYRVQMFDTALKIAATRDVLVFGPVLGAKDFLERGELVEVPVEGWNVAQPLYLYCQLDRVRGSVKAALQAAVAKLLET